MGGRILAGKLGHRDPMACGLWLWRACAHASVWPRLEEDMERYSSSRAAGQVSGRLRDSHRRLPRRPAGFGLGVPASLRVRRAPPPRPRDFDARVSKQQHKGSLGARTRAHVAHVQIARQGPWPPSAAFTRLPQRLLSPRVLVPYGGTPASERGPRGCRGLGAPASPCRWRTARRAARSHPPLPLFAQGPIRAALRPSPPSCPFPGKGGPMRPSPLEVQVQGRRSPTRGGVL